MSAGSRPFLAAAVQAASVFLDREDSLEKACDLIGQTGLRGAKLIVLPETFIPAYPAWVWTLPLHRRQEVIALHRELVENAVDVPGPVTEQLGLAARAAGAWVAIGVDERDTRHSRSTLYNTLLVFDDQGELVEHRRKLMPTGGERLVWAQGEPVAPRVHETPYGRLAGLICWENYMPLARMALYDQGAQVHVAPTWDSSEAWIASMRHIAREGRMYVISVCQALHRDAIPDRFKFKDTFPLDRKWINPGNSLIVDPEGAVIAGPVADREETLFAEIDPGRTSGSRWIFDAAGHYNRPDLFEFSVRTPVERSATRRSGPARRAAKSTARNGRGPKAARTRRRSGARGRR